jgi:hypothetical protein
MTSSLVLNISPQHSLDTLCTLLKYNISTPALPIMAAPPLSENKQKMARGELYHAFTPELLGERARCKAAVREFNAVAGVASRRESVRLWRE